MTGSRALVERSIVDEFRRRLSERLEKVQAEPASNPASDMGPLISMSNVARVERVGERCDLGRCEGAGTWRSFDRSDPRRRGLLSPDVP